MSAKNRFFVFILVLGSVLLIITLLVGLLLVLAFPFTSASAVREIMLKNLKENYGTLALTTTAWDNLQGYLLCCAVDDNGWSAWRESDWYLDENSMVLNDLQLIPASNPAFKMVPESCCYRKLDYLTRQLTDEYENLSRCQNWQYGPPKFPDGAHNDAIYYRVGMPEHDTGVYKKIQLLDRGVWILFPILPGNVNDSRLARTLPNQMNRELCRA
ncbi:hypothetical protein Aperf_G00000078434 [Anoplocephala perfoliata]